ncbi:hypothetical protein VB005_01892 [Metarhizium brunneum]
MSRPVKAWIFTGCIDYAPDGHLRLGQILKEPQRPGSALIPEGPPPVPSSYKISYSKAEGLNINYEQNLGTSFDYWGEAVGIPINISAGMSNDVRSKLVWEFKEVRGETTIFGLDYIEHICTNRNVLAYIKEKLTKFSELTGWLGPRLYIVTGVRVAIDARLKSQEDTIAMSARATAGGDGSQSGVPFRGGANLAFGADNHQTTTFAHATNFVYAYKCNEIHYVPQISQQEYIKGNVQSLKDDAAETPTQQFEGISVLARNPVDKNEFGVDEGEGQEHIFFGKPDGEHVFKYLVDLDFKQRPGSFTGAWELSGQLVGV